VRQRRRRDPEIVRTDALPTLAELGPDLRVHTRDRFGDRDRSQALRRALRSPDARMTPCSSSLTVITLIARSSSPRSRALAPARAPRTLVEGQTPLYYYSSHLCCYRGV
jgi:hypothetical protein